MKLNTVGFSDDFYKGETVEVNVNGHYLGKTKPLADKIVLSSLDDDGNTVAVDAVFLNREDTMSEDELRSEVLKEVSEFGMEASDEDLDIIVGNVENWLAFTDYTISGAVKHTLNYEDPWNN